MRPLVTVPVLVIDELGKAGSDWELVLDELIRSDTTLIEQLYLRPITDWIQGPRLMTTRKVLKVYKNE